MAQQHSDGDIDIMGGFVKLPDGGDRREGMQKGGWVNLAHIVLIQLSVDTVPHRKAKVKALLTNGEAIELSAFEGKNASGDAADWQASLMRKIGA